MATTEIALVGDYNPEVLAHRAIERSFALAESSGQSEIQGLWVGTSSIAPGDERGLVDFSGIWCVPASPYANMEGALWAIRFARERQVPFLGTCGGFQHALIEYARNVLGLFNADHAETNPDSAIAFISRLSCSLTEATQEITVLGDSAFAEAYGSKSGLESYCCNYGLNPEFEHSLSDGPLEITARDSRGEPRAFLLKGHPFFMGTLFQPERRALNHSLHPIVSAFFGACRNRTLGTSTLTTA
jgi:CTP synthase (UTP-ammonia lyase)